MRKIKLNKSEFILIIFGLFIFFEPQSFKSLAFDYLPYIDNIYKILKLVVGVCIIFIYLKKTSLSKNFILMLLFQLIAFILTLVNSGDIIRFIGPAITTIVMVASAELLLLSDKLIDASKIIVKYFRIIFFINILTVILVDFSAFFSNKIIYFLGIENRWIFTYIPWMLFEFILYFTDEKKYGKIVKTYYVLMVISLFYKWSVAAMFISLIYVLLFSKKIREKIKVSVNYLIGIIIMNILIVFCKFQYIFEPLIRKLGKDPTISGRTFLWDKIINENYKVWLLGHGMQSISYDKEYFGSSSGVYNLPFLRVIHAHNSFMTTLYRYGIFSLLLYIYILYYNFKTLSKTKSKYAAVLFITLIVCLLLSLFDTIDCSGFYFTLGLISYIYVIDNGILTEKESNFKDNFSKKLKKSPILYSMFEKIYHFFYRCYCCSFGIAFRIFPKDKNKIVISNYYGKGYGDNAKYICDELIKHNYKIIWLVKPQYFNDKRFPKDVIKVKYNSIRGLYEMATAKIWIDNCRKIFYPPKRKNQIYIQTWHSSLRLKKIEKDAINDLSSYYIKSAKKDSKMIDIITSGCEFSTRIYKNSFWYSGNVVECGSPRCDLFFDKKKKAIIKEKVYENFDIELSKKIILYAPTFRTNNNDTNYYLDCDYIADNIPDNYILMVRYHPLEKNKLKLNDKIINVTDYPDMQELICSIEFLITDYSGCCFDGMINGTKCILFAKDKEEYLQKERSFYFEYDKLPFPFAKTEKELLNKLEKFNLEKYNRKVSSFCKNIGLRENGNASITILQYIVGANKK